MAFHEDNSIVKEGGGKISVLVTIGCCSELMLILGDSKKDCGPPCTVGAYGGQVMNSFGRSLTHARSSGSLNSFCDYFPSPRMYNWNRDT